MNAAQLIAFLNAIEIGELESIRSKLEAARGACVELEQQELAQKLTEAVSALTQADMTTYRKRLKTVVAQLGHLK